TPPRNKVPLPCPAQGWPGESGPSWDAAAPRLALPPRGPRRERSERDVLGQAVHELPQRFDVDTARPATIAPPRIGHHVAVRAVVPGEAITNDLQQLVAVHIAQQLLNREHVVIPAVGDHGQAAAFGPGPAEPSGLDLVFDTERTIGEHGHAGLSFPP